MDAERFVEIVAADCGCDAERAEGLAFVVMGELRDRLTPKESADVCAQLPQKLQRWWREGEDPARAPQKIHAAELVGRVRKRAVLPDDREAERAVRAVFRALRLALGSPTGTTGEAWDVASVLPKDLKALWLDAPGS